MSHLDENDSEILMTHESCIIKISDFHLTQKVDIIQEKRSSILWIGSEFLNQSIPALNALMNQNLYYCILTALRGSLCTYLFLRPVPFPTFPPTRVCRDGRAERLSCCLLGPLRPPGMVAYYCGNQGQSPPTKSHWDFPLPPQWATMYCQATVNQTRKEDNVS